MADPQKHEHHEDERQLQRDPNLPTRVERETDAPQKQEWPEETGGRDPQLGDVDRQSVSTPEKILDRVSTYEGSETHDRENRNAPDLVEKGTTCGQPATPNETEGSIGRTSGSRQGYLKVDQGPGGQDRT